MLNKRFLSVMLGTFCMLMGLLLLSDCHEKHRSENFDEMTTVMVRLPYFSSISCSLPITVHFVQGDSVGMRIEGAKEVVKNIKARVKGEWLDIYDKRDTWNLKSYDDYGVLDIYLTSPDLIGVRFSGSGSFICNSLLDTDTLRIDCKGSGDMTFDEVLCDRLDVVHHGSGSTLFDKVNSQTGSFSMWGSGSMETSLWSTRRVELDMRGSGSITASLFNCDRVKADVLGSGNITLKGSVNSVEQGVMGSGEILTDELRVHPNKKRAAPTAADSIR